MAGRSRAWQYLTGTRDVRRLAAAAAVATGGRRSVRSDLAATWRLFRAYVRGEYRAVRLRTVLAVVAGLVYFLSPIDLVPDLLFGLGFTDDAAVLALVFTLVRRELVGFLAWEHTRVPLDVTVLHTVRDG
jgi:uncharacterized membrane protein YkvA (DUF1232 family)